MKPQEKIDEILTNMIWDYNTNDNGGMDDIKNHNKVKREANTKLRALFRKFGCELIGDGEDETINHSVGHPPTIRNDFRATQYKALTKLTKGLK